MLKTNNLVTFALVLLLLLVDNDKSSVHAYEYCSKSVKKQICPKGTTHFICNKNDILPSKGEFMAHVPFTNKILRTLLQEHNDIRNSVASGDVSCSNDPRSTQVFPKAARMRELVWDQELAFLAREQGSQCNGLAAPCHNSKRHPHSGQNLDVVHDNNKVTIATVMKSIFKKWFDQKDTVRDTTALASGQATYPSAKEFSLIVNEHTSHVGCAISYCTKCKVRSEPDCTKEDKESIKKKEETEETGITKEVERNNTQQQDEERNNTLQQEENCNNTQQEAGGQSRLLFPHDSPPISVGHCYYLICNYNAENIASRAIYDTTDKEPASRCNFWDTTKSSKYPNLCANTGRIFHQTNLPAHN